MSQPTPYVRDYSFTDFSASNPSGVPGPQIDAQLDDVSLTLGEVLANLALIQRDDGKLANGAVTADALSDGALDLLTARGIGAPYASETVGLANTAIGDVFSVDNGDGTGSIYSHTSTGSLLLRTIILDVRAATAAGLMGSTDGTVQADINARPTSADIALETAAAAIGSTGPSTVQADLNARPTSAALAASGGAALVGFKQSGASTVAATVNSKLAERVSFEDLGAIGDGVADDGATINAAIYARYSGLATSQADTFVEIHGTPGNTYKFTTPVTVRQQRIRFLGNGASIVCAGAYAFDFTQDGSANQNLECEVSGWKISGATAAAIRGTNAEFLRILNNWLTANADAINLYGAVEAMIGFNYIRENTGKGIVLQPTAAPNEAQRCQVFGNRIWLNGSYGLHLINGLGHSVYSNDFEQNTGREVYLQSSGANQFSNNYSEPTAAATVVYQDNTAGPVGARVSDGNNLGDWFIGGGAAYDFDLVAGNSTRIGETRYGTGNVRTNAACTGTMIAPALAIAATLTNGGSNTTDQATVAGRTNYRASAGSNRLVIDPFASGGAKVGSDDGLLRLYGVNSLGKGTTAGSNLTGFVDITGTATTATVTFPTAEPDANYTVQLSCAKIGGTPAAGSTNASLSAAPVAASFAVVLDAAPGAGNTVRVYWFIVRTA